MEAALVFVENCGHAGKTVGEVMAGIVAKCIAAARTKTKELALQVTQYKTTHYLRLTKRLSSCPASPTSEG